MASSFLNKNDFLARSTHCLVRGSNVLQIVCPVLKCPKTRRNENFIEVLEITDAGTTETSEMEDFLQKLKKVVLIVLYGPAISQSDCRKAGPYQLPYNNEQYSPSENQAFSFPVENGLLHYSFIMHSFRSLVSSEF